MGRRGQIQRETEEHRPESPRLGCRKGRRGGSMRTSASSLVQFGWMASVIAWAGIEEHSFGIMNEDGMYVLGERV